MLYDIGNVKLIVMVFMMIAGSVPYELLVIRAMVHVVFHVTVCVGMLCYYMLCHAVEC